MTRDDYLKTILGTYSLVSELSRKNGCRVLRLRNRAVGKDLVLRSFPEPVRAYEELCGIRCENLPLIYDVIELEDGQIVLEEFIEGMTVAEVMETGRYRPSGARRVLRAVCSALTVLHERDIVHRDVKPENVMIDRNGRVVLIDLNAARRVSAAKKDTVVMGTVGYASPEQLGVTQSDARTDLYAVGVMLNVMLTGKHPSEELAKGKAGRVVLKCTNVNPDLRYRSAAKLSAAL
ncbi:MAG: serine/threonine protein kinase [Clostridia bacterium]|nr:serine/threonine protein kinase [Clostridia bacterium]